MISEATGKEGCAWKREARIRPQRHYRRRGLGEALLLIDIVNAEGLIIVRTVWSTTSDRHRGRRLTRHETIMGGRAALMARLDELTAALLLLPPSAAAMQEGSAAMAPDPDPAPAAGGDRRAA